MEKAPAVSRPEGLRSSESSPASGSVEAPYAPALALQHAAGNCAVSSFLEPSLAPGVSPGGVPHVVGEVLRSPGRRLDSITRALMESRLGHDFGSVTIHADAKAEESAQSVAARAYTVGQHVVFDSGLYAPNTGPGRNLLAHELAHVVQQTAGGSRLGDLSLGSPWSPAEREASSAARTVAEGGTAEVVGRSPQGTVQRVPWGPCPPGRRLPANRPFRYRSAELALVTAHYLPKRRGNVVASNVDPLEELSTRGPQGDMVRAAQDHFRSGKGLSPVRRRRRTGSPARAPAPREEESAFEQTEGMQAALEAAEFALVRPDVIDFSAREVYDVTTEKQAPRKVSVIRGYVKLLEDIRTLNEIPGGEWTAGKTLPAPPPPILNYRISDREVICLVRLTSMRVRVSSPTS